MAEIDIDSVLICKHDEITGQIDQSQFDLRQSIIDLDNRDASIRPFKPDSDPEVTNPMPVQEEAMFTSARYRGASWQIRVKGILEGEHKLL